LFDTRGCFVIATPCFALQLLAQDPAPKGPGLLDPGNPMFLFLALGLMFYFIVFRPARRQEKERQAMVEAVKKNDEVVTASGIVGTVVSLKKEKDEVLLESGPSRFRILKSSIARVLSRGDAPNTSAADDADSEGK